MDTPPLKFNLKLAEEAKLYAEELLATGKWEYSDSINGENLYLSHSEEQNDIPFTTTKSTDHWYSQLYDPGYCSPSNCSLATNAFTQIVWANTKKIGCGFA